MTAAPLRVMTYNLRYADEVRPHAWSSRREPMANLIRRVAPDVIATQEGLHHQLRDLAGQLEGYTWLGTGRHGGTEGEFMAVFYRHDRLDPVDEDHFWLSDTPEVAGSITWGTDVPRMATRVRFTDRDVGNHFQLCNTHFDVEVEAARRASAELVAARLDALDHGLPQLLVGDFNEPADTGGRCWSILVDDAGFEDTWQAAPARDPDNETGYGTAPGFTAPSAGGPRVDWILARGGVRTVYARMPLADDPPPYPSDHLPVCADVVITSEDATAVPTRQSRAGGADAEGRPPPATIRRARR